MGNTTTRRTQPNVHVFIVNFQIAGDPFIIVVVYWAIDLVNKSSEHFERLYRRFINE